MKPRQPETETEAEAETAVGGALFILFDHLDQNLAKIIGGLELLHLTGDALTGTDKNTAVAIHYLSDSLRPLAEDTKKGVTALIEICRSHGFDGPGGNVVRIKHPDSDDAPPAA